MAQSNLSHCGVQWPAGSKRCGKCGTPLESSAIVPAISDKPEAVTDGSRWARTPGLFAQRIEIADVKALFTRHLDIEEGTRGLLIQHGKFMGELDPDRHTLQTVTDRLKGLVFGTAVSAVVVDVSYQRLDVNCSGLRSRDNLEINVIATMTLAVNDPQAFFRNVMKGSRRVTTQEVTELFQPSVLAIVNRVIRSTGVDELEHDDELMSRLQDELRDGLREQLTDLGLDFVRLDFARFSCPARDVIVRETAKLDEQEALQKLRERQRRIQQQLERETTDDEIARIQSKQDLTDFMGRLVQKSEQDRKDREFDTKLRDLGQQRDWEIVYDKFIALKDDLTAKRNFLKVSNELQHEKRLSELKHQLARQNLENKFELDGITLTQQLKLEQEQFDADTERQEIEFSRDLEQRLAIAKTNAEEERIRSATTVAIQQDVWGVQKQKLEGLLGLERQQREQAVTIKSAEQKLELDRKTAESALSQTEQAATHARELERLRVLNEVKTEILMTVASPEQAALLAEQLKLGALQRFTPEQLAMLKAAESPELARALALKYQAEAAANSGASAATLQLYERMFAQQAGATDQLSSVYQQNLQVVQRMHDVSLETQRDTAVAAVTGGLKLPTTTPVNQQPPPSGTTAKDPQKDRIGFKTPNMATQVTCPKCNQPTDSSVTFCRRCGAVLKASP